MDILKPETLELTSQPLDWGGTLYQSLTISFGFDLLTGAPLPIEKALIAALKSLGSGDCLDMGLPKKQAEWLLVGNACTPRGEPMRGLVLQTEVGASRREWLVRGEHDQPFTVMPLTWANTWGASQHPDNPLGCGLEKDAAGVLRLPTVLDKNDGDRRPACPGPLGAWPCRMKNMGTYDAAWLKNEWPGVPKDFDWAFYNLAQPQQRLARLDGGEQILLTNLHPEHARIAVAAPDNQLCVEVRRAAPTSEDPAAPEGWKRCAATRDTVWLFPGELTGLYLWHCLVPCADTVASDIAAIRLTLEPEAVVAPDLPLPPPEVAAPPEAEAAAPAAEGATATVLGGAAVAAGVGAAAAAAHTGGSAHGVAGGEAAKEEPSDGPLEKPAPVAVSEPAASAEDGMVEDALQHFAESRDEINAALAEQGIPPLTPEQEAEMEQRVREICAQMAQTLDQPEPPDDVFTALVEAGVSEADASAAARALELEQPSPSDFDTQAEWEAAVAEYLGSFAAIMHPSDDILGMMRTVLGAQGPESMAALEDLSGGKPLPEAVQALVERGVEPQVAERLLDHLENDDIPGTDDMDALIAYAGKLEAECGLPADSVAGLLDAVRKAMIETGLLEEPSPGSDAVPDAASGVAEPEPLGQETQAEQEKQPSAPLERSDRDTASGSGASAEQAVPSGGEQGGTSSHSRETVAAALLAGASLVGAVLAGLELQGMDFSDRDLRGANFDGAKLDGADFSRSDVTGGSFVGASLPDALFHETRLPGVSFASAAAPDADFTGAVLTGAVFSGAALTGVTFAKAEGSGLKAAGAQCDKMRMHFCTLDNADFEGAQLQHADFHEASLENASFRKADLTDASLGFGTRAPGVVCTGATLTGSSWKAVPCTGGTFTGVQADNASFTDCDLSGTTWRSARARQGDFSRARLHKADARYADLYGASFREAQAETADFSGASLYSADLYRFGYGPQTGLEGTDLTATIVAARAKA